MQVTEEVQEVAQPTLAHKRPRRGCVRRPFTCLVQLSKRLARPFRRQQSRSRPEQRQPRGRQRNKNECWLADNTSGMWQHDTLDCNAVAIRGAHWRRS
eukprot:566304-Prymnesium_polylepis.1